MIKTYTEMLTLPTFEERFRYLSLHGQVGKATFGYDRWMNQQFYNSTEWRSLRHHVIARDNGCDLGVEDREIYDRIVIHHINPMEAESLMQGDFSVLDMEFLITTCHTTHNAIHYGDERLLRKPYVPRRPGDTKLW